MPTQLHLEVVPRRARSVEPGTAALPVPWDYFIVEGGKGSRGLLGEGRERENGEWRRESGKRGEGM